MPLSPGARLGPYDVVGLLGVGGMGEVYRAHDSRLGRDVAIKVVRAGDAEHADSLLRFEREARAVAALDHPNILAVHDVGVHDGRPYLVSELLEGETLRAATRGKQLSVKRAVDYGVQIARGLGAAHARGIVHRDVKPENLFLTRDGRVKILDFGLAALHEGEADPSRATDTRSHPTDTGVVLGTAGYMAPEQARGEPADHRADVFALGAILYELLSGRRAFSGSSRAETLVAILKDEPPDLAGVQTRVPAPLDRIVRRCLDKRPDDRFHSAHDLALALEAVAETGGGASAPDRQRKPWNVRGWAAAVLLLGLAGLGGVALGRRTTTASPPSFRQLTFRRGHVSSARFMPDGQTVVYSAAWDGARPELFEARLDSLDPRRLGLGIAQVAGTLPGEVLVLLSQQDASGSFLGVYPATLARVPLGGGPPRELAQGITDASASLDGSRMAVLRPEIGRTILEFPPGTRIHETGGFAYGLRVSPDGQRVAFVESPSQEQPPRSLRVAGPDGSRQLSSGWAHIQGVAWPPSGREVWFTATRQGLGRAQELYAVDLAGRERLVLRAPGRLILNDIASAGRALLSVEARRSESYARGPDDKVERDLSWLGFSIVGAISSDGRSILFSEEGGTSGPNGAVCLRRLTDPAPIRLGEGWGMDLSPDGTQALIRLSKPVPRLGLLSTGPGETRLLPPGGIVDHDWAWFFPDGRRILIQGRERGKQTRLYVQELASGAPTPLTPEGVETALSYPLSADGQDMLANRNGSWSVQHLAGGPARAIPLAQGDEPIRFARDGRSVFVREAGEGWPARVARMDLSTGRKQPWLELQPPDLAGAASLGSGNILLTPDGRSYAYLLHRVLSDLYLVEGLR